MMLEDLAKSVLRQKETIYLMRLVPSLMHAGFVQQKTKEAVLASFDKMLDEHAVRERDHLAKQGQPKLMMIDTTGLGPQAIP